MTPRIIIQCLPENDAEAMRAARTCLNPGYMWDDDGIAFVGFRGLHGREYCHFTVRRTQTGVSVYDHALATSGEMK